MELPASFVDYTRSLLGEEEYEKLAVALQQEPPVSMPPLMAPLSMLNGNSLPKSKLLLW